MKRATSPGIRRPNRHLWFLDPLMELPGCEVRTMFGTKACYLNGRLVLVLADKAEPWRGVLVPAERENHRAICAAFPSLSPHPVLGKWLYLPESGAGFERDAMAIVERIRRLDPLFGVVPERKKPRPGRPRPR